MHMEDAKKRGMSGKITAIVRNQGKYKHIYKDKVQIKCMKRQKPVKTSNRVRYGLQVSKVRLTGAGQAVSAASYDLRKDLQ